MASPDDWIENDTADSRTGAVLSWMNDDPTLESRYCRKTVDSLSIGALPGGLLYVLSSLMVLILSGIPSLRDGRGYRTGPISIGDDSRGRIN
jgi:hypothetical protein